MKRKFVVLLLLALVLALAITGVSCGKNPLTAVLGGSGSFSVGIAKI
ncbi:MAG: hypothetical protein V1752_05895 [Candidatus Firestonebacteria bacterium]